MGFFLVVFFHEGDDRLLHLWLREVEKKEKREIFIKHEPPVYTTAWYILKDKKEEEKG